MKKDVIITDFNKINIRSMKMPFIVIYEHPKDYSESYVARLFDVDKPTNVVIINKDLEELRKNIPRGMVKFKRAKEDDEKILESYC